MSRIIKFRVWDLFQQQMITEDVDSKASFDSDGSILTFGVFGNNPIMQFTGLTDKNGKEIYEGDIFEDEDGIIVIGWNDKEAKFSIYLYGRNMYLNEGGGEEYSNDVSIIDTDFTDFEYIQSLEIIGNIHENPDPI